MGPRTFTLLASLLAFCDLRRGQYSWPEWAGPGSDRHDRKPALNTLSDAAVEVAQDLSEPVELELVYSRQLAADFPDIRAYGARVRELLNEISARSKGNVRVIETDPSPFTPEEDRIIDVGLDSAPTPKGDPLYFGIIGRNSVDDEIIIPFLEPQRESLLEYDLVKLISQLDDPHSAHNWDHHRFKEHDGPRSHPTRSLYPSGDGPQLFRSNRSRQTYQVLPDGLDALMIVHPFELSPPAAI